MPVSHTWSRTTNINPDRRPSLISPDNGTQALGSSDSCEAGNAASDDQHLGGRDAPRRRDLT